MRTLQTEILSGHDGILPTGDAGPATGRLNEGTLLINIDKSIRASWSSNWHIYVLFDPTIDCIGGWGLTLTHLKVFNLSHRAGFATHGLWYVVVGLTNIPLRHLHFEIEFLSLVALQTINTCNIFIFIFWVKLDISITNIYIYFRISANNFILVSAFMFEIFPSKADKNRNTRKLNNV